MTYQKNEKIEVLDHEGPYMKDSKIPGRKQCGNCREFVGVRSTNCVNCNSSFTKSTSQEKPIHKHTEFTPEQLKMIKNAADYETARIQREWEECSRIVRKGLGE